MKGASELPCPTTMMTPRNNNIMTMGIIQVFLFSRRKKTNSLAMDSLLILENAPKISQDCFSDIPGSYGVWSLNFQ